ncbi:MAG TPA: NAD/NADP octopine/nopaline dehydrogenase family protein [Dehalococcoidia bacterium]|nr:NAD/NADP octopine/nopaline dehydrogenase family protein [Dehalococcoidia bacterium]
MNIKHVAVLGAGNGGITAAADLTLRGFHVSLFELPQFSRNIDLLKKRKAQVVLKEPGGLVSKATIGLLTTDIKEALSGAQLVLVSIPSLWTEEFARVCAPFISGDQVIVMHTAACMCSVRFVNAARQIGIKTDFKIGELATLAYGTRASAEKGEIELYLRVKEFYFSAYPAVRTGELLEAVRQIYKEVMPIDNVWGTTLSNGNPECHPGPCLLNAGRIEYSKGEFWLYVEGITGHTLNVLLEVGEERMALARALGYQLDDGTTARIKRGYLEEGSELLYLKYNHSPVFSRIKGPTSLESRYFTEDISNGLVLYSSLGKALAVPTPTTNAIITLGSVLLKRDFMTEGVTLEKLGFEGMNRDQLISAVS